MRYLSRQSGFTLMELIVVLLIISLGTAVVTANFGLGYDSNVLRQEAVKLRAAMGRAREISLIERVPVDLTVLAPEEHGEQLWRYSIARYAEPPEPWKPELKVQMPSGISAEALRVVFYPKGNSSGGTLSVKDRKGRQYVIEVDPVTGLARLKRL